VKPSAEIDEHVEPREWRKDEVCLGRKQHRIGDSSGPVSGRRRVVETILDVHLHAVEAQASLHGQPGEDAREFVDEDPGDAVHPCLERDVLSSGLDRQRGAMALSRSALGGIETSEAVEATSGDFARRNLPGRVPSA
jgi:hypothetical protein